MDILTVSQLNFYVKSIINSDQVLNNTFVLGEISNFKSNFKSGHAYFTLKDEKSVIRCVIFSSNYKEVTFDLEDGIKVFIRGRVSVYEATGQYQLYVEDIEPAGLGALNLAFEQLKLKLMQEGLFDIDKKRKLPKYPKSIGVITSASGAAIKDIESIIKRRYPVVNILLYPVLVQGSESVAQIIDGIDYFNRVQNVDVIIIGRGGGSLEDIYAFNDENLARAIFSCEIPVISAVGHETDITICDLVADVRAATPSVAAELCIPDIQEVVFYIDHLLFKLVNAIKDKIDNQKIYLNSLKKSLNILSPLMRINSSYNYIQHLNYRLLNLLESKLSVQRNNLDRLYFKLKIFNPDNVMLKGYVLAKNSKQCFISKVCDFNIGDNITLKVIDGIVECKVIKSKLVDLKEN